MTDTQPRWMPKVFTSPLRDDYVSDGPKLRHFTSLFMKDDEGNTLVWDEWQSDLLDRILERYPDDWPVEELRGRLRYRQVLISVGRQCGKSQIAAALAFWALFMHEYSPYIVGLASNKEQADLVYKRVYETVLANPALGRRLSATGTRGITRTDKPGYYVTKPAKADALQGIPVTCCLFDEVHICDREMWSAMVLGTQAKKDGIVIGITTAGDAESVLLKDLYLQGHAAAEGHGSERFGFFLWQADEGAAKDDPEAIMDGSPAVACGRRDINVILDAVRSMPDEDVFRYVHNRFVESSKSWLPMHLWYAANYGPVPDGDIVFSVDRSPSWEFATITATVKKDDYYYTEVVATWKDPNLQQLIDLCVELNTKHNPIRFAMDGYTLGDLGKELERRGIPVKIIRQGDVTNACATTYALIATGKVRHNNDLIVRQQMPFAVRKNIGEAWRISRTDSTTNIDAVMATVIGLYVASIEEGFVPQLY